MKKFITRDRLAEFVEQMWDAGLRVDTRPTENLITVWSDDLSRHTNIDVASSQHFDEVVGQVIEAVKVEEK